MPSKRKRPSRKKEPGTMRNLFHSSKPPVHVRNTAEVWTDVFFQSIDTLLSQKSAYDGADAELQKDKVYLTQEGWAASITQQARLIADSAITTYEDRWPGVLIS